MSLEAFIALECYRGCLANLCWSPHMVKLSAQGHSKLFKGGGTKVMRVNFYECDPIIWIFPESLSKHNEVHLYCKYNSVAI